jgi:hypothetical protein
MNVRGVADATGATLPAVGVIMAAPAPISSASAS